MTDTSQDLVYLFDVDNTLLDNDAVQEDLSAHLQTVYGVEARDRYWAVFETLRTQLGYADYLGALQRYRLEVPDDVRLLQLSAFLIDYPFAERLYAGSLATIARCARNGRCAILSDGDVVFQPRKVHRSGIWDAVQANVLIYLHKEQMLDAVARHLPARHYVMVDDKLRILTAMKAVWGKRLTTVFVRQGHYALDSATIAQYPAADMTVERIGDFSGLDTSRIF